jgi:hypothetical protein
MKKHFNFHKIVDLKNNKTPTISKLFLKFLFLVILLLYQKRNQPITNNNIFNLKSKCLVVNGHQKWIYLINSGWLIILDKSTIRNRWDNISYLASLLKLNTALILDHNILHYLNHNYFHKNIFNKMLSHKEDFFK